AMALTSMSCRGLSRSRWNQGVALGVGPLGEISIAVSLGGKSRLVLYTSPHSDCATRGVSGGSAPAGTNAMQLIQFLDAQGQTRVGKIDASGTRVEVLAGATSIYELALRCFHERSSLDTLAGGLKVDGVEPYQPLRHSGRMLPPLTHPDPHHCLVSGTGLTHLGSAATRDAMHKKAASAAASKAPATA